MTAKNQPESTEKTIPRTGESPFRLLWYVGEWPVTIRALRHPNFRYFWIGQLFSLIGTWMQNTAQAWLVYQLAKEAYGPANAAFYVGLVGAMGSAPMFFLTLYAGVIADRHNRRTILIITQSIFLLLAAGLALLVSTHHVQLWHVAIFAIFSGLTMAFDMPTRQTFVKDMATPEDLLNAIALNSSIFNLARIIGPGIAGVLMALPFIGVAGVLYLNAASYIAVIFGLILINYRPIPLPPNAASVWEHLTEGFRYVWGHSVLRLIMLLMAIYSVFGFSYGVLMPVIANQVLKQSEHGFGFLMAATGAGAFIGSIFLAAIAYRMRKGHVLFMGGLVFVLTLILFSQVSICPPAYQFPLALILIAFVGGGFVISSASINIIIQEIAPNHLRGRVVSIWAFIFAGFTPIGALYVGALARATSSPTAILIGATVCLLTLAIISLRAPWFWRLE